MAVARAEVFAGKCTRIIMTLSEFYLELQNSIRHCDNCLEFPVQKVEQRNPTFPENLSLSFQLRLGA